MGGAWERPEVKQPDGKELVKSQVFTPATWRKNTRRLTLLRKAEIPPVKWPDSPMHN